MIRIHTNGNQNASLDSCTLRWVLGIKMIEKIGVDEIRARACVANISETIDIAVLRWLGHVEITTEEYVVMRTWTMKVTGH